MKWPLADSPAEPAGRLRTLLAYSGTTLTTRSDYVRLDGPSVWLEYSCQGGIMLSLTHPHSVWRDKSKDYGGN